MPGSAELPASVKVARTGRASAFFAGADAPLFVTGPVGHLRFRFVLQRRDVFGEVVDAVERDLAAHLRPEHRARVQPCAEEASELAT